VATSTRARLWRVLAVLALLAGAAVLLLLLRDRMTPNCPVNAAQVMLDPGHGGPEPGAVNERFGLIERDLNLDVSNRVRALLEAEGFTVALTRESNETGLSQSARGRIANACGALVYVSIHHNSISDPGPNHVLTLYAEDQDIPFAETMQAAMVRELARGEIYDGGLRRLRNGGMIAARMPAALVEPIFLSNMAEAARLTASDGDRRQQIARSIADGIVTWLRQEGVTGTPIAERSSRP
jgi:N-acetylmuramoyl-L-alanine amidase